MKSYISLAEKYKSHKGFFITGTDTDVGKTFFSIRLLNFFTSMGFKTAGLKPLSSGCIQTEDGLRNNDALLLQAHASLKFKYEKINPWPFLPAIAPHLAAAEINQKITAQKLHASCHEILTSSADFVIVEGAGGWLTPLNESETLADFAKILNFPIILVVRMRLGCLNHTLLTYQHIKNSNLKLAGWVANTMPPAMDHLAENIATLKAMLNTPLLEIL